MTSSVILMASMAGRKLSFDMAVRGSLGHHASDDGVLGKGIVHEGVIVSKAMILKRGLFAYEAIGVIPAK